MIAPKVSVSAGGRVQQRKRTTMNPGADREAITDATPSADDPRSEERALESRSWEPPCWPSDVWNDTAPMRRRAIGWRGIRAS